MSRRHLQIAIGVVVAVIGGYLVMSPLVVAAALARPHTTTTQMINLRASWGGPVVGLGAFIAWLPAVKPWLRTVLGLLLWGMGGVGLARTLGFALDGDPDRRQALWLVLEIAIVCGSAIGLRRMARAAAGRSGASSSS